MTPDAVNSATATAIDPITFEVIRHKLQAITEEQAITLKRVSGSPVVTEATDFGQAWALEPLAAAQASLGRFDEAIATIDRALALPMLPAALRGRLRADREKFVQQQPLRELP